MHIAAQLALAGLIAFCGPSALAQCEPQPLTPAGLDEDDELGWSTAVHDDIALLAAPREEGGGVVYVYRYDGSTWMQSGELRPDDLAPGDEFGMGLSFDGTTALVGAPRHAQRTGAAYLYEFDGNSWTLLTKLTASDASVGDEFGRSVCIRADTAVIGAALNQDAGPGSGSAYVFGSQGDAWTEQARLLAFDAEEGDHFGRAVTLFGERVAIGAPDEDSRGLSAGAVYLYRRDGQTWTHEDKLTAFDAATDATFGRWLTGQDDTLVVASPVAGINFGAAYVYQDRGPFWTEHKIRNVGATSLHLRGPHLAIGDTFIGCGGTSVVRVFEGQGTDWTERAEIPDPHSECLDLFGNAVALNGRSLIVGASGRDDDGDNAGAVYAFPLSPCIDCYADCNADGTIDTRDFVCYLSRFAAGDERADCDGSGAITTQDFLCFLNLWATGC